MVTAQNILYSQSAVRRLLQLPAQAEVQIRQFANAVWVWVKGQRPTFLSKKLFKQHFVDRRKQEAKQLQIVPYISGGYVVSNPANQSTYIVTLKPDAVECACEDYKNQLQFFRRACCKHSYALLFFLGYGSLADYLKAAA